MVESHSNSFDPSRFSGSQTNKVSTPDAGGGEVVAPPPEGRSDPSSQPENGEAKPPEEPPTSTSETPEGHVYELAASLSAREQAKETAEARKFAEGKAAPHREFPDRLFRLPVPNEVFCRLPDLSGSAARFTLLLVRAAFRYDPERERWAASPRWITASELEDAVEHGAGMSRRSMIRAARELEDLGWASVREGGRGEPHRFRLLLSAPEKRFTWLPAALFETQARFSASGLQVLLTVYRETWGWTRREERSGGRKTVHRNRAPLSYADFERKAGLHKSTVRRAVKELRETGILERGRPHAASPFFYRATEPNCPPNLEKLHTPTSRVENLTHRQAPAREGDKSQTPTSSDTHRSERPVKGSGRGRDRRERQCNSGTGRNGRKRPENELPTGAETSRNELDEEQTELFEVLTGTGIGLDAPVAAKLVHRLDPSLIRRTVEELRSRSEEIKNPAGWTRKALEELWFAPKTREKKPNRRRKRSGRRGRSEKPLAKVFEQIATEEEDWEWDPAGESGPAEQRAATDGRGGEVAGPGSEGRPGVTHGEMLELIDALGPNISTDDFETVEQEGRKLLWVPSKELARWAWKRRETGGQAFQQAAREVISLRKKHEGR